jgi:hypothetical protein
MHRRDFLTAAMILVRSMTRPAAEAASHLTISWEKNYLTIRATFRATKSRSSIWKPIAAQAQPTVSGANGHLP